MKIEKILTGEIKPITKFVCTKIQTSSIEEYYLPKLPNGTDIDGKHLIIGIDPGSRNLGITFLPHIHWYPSTYSFEIKMEKSDNKILRFYDMILAMQLIQGIFSRQSGLLDYDMIGIIIEGAAYNKSFGQVELAEIRAVLATYFMSQGEFPSILPPQTIRKLAFGSAKIKAKELWVDLPPNAAASLGCALAYNKSNITMVERIGKNEKT